ncbi:MAG: hypothetical protein ABIL76_03530 [candidate division WOR-3 bacterium]
MIFLISYISEKAYISEYVGEWKYEYSKDLGNFKKVQTPIHKQNPIFEKKVNPYRMPYRKPSNNFQIMDSLSNEVRITYSGTVRDVKAAYSKRIGKVVYVWSENDPSCGGSYCLHVWREGYSYIYVFSWSGTSDPDIAIGDTNRWALISFNDAADDSLYWIYFALSNNYC